MNPEQWQLVKQVFGEAIEAKSPEEVNSLLRERCPDEQMRKQVGCSPATALAAILVSWRGLPYRSRRNGSLKGRWDWLGDLSVDFA
jgi:hypothetical protein